MNRRAYVTAVVADIHREASPRDLWLALWSKHLDLSNQQLDVGVRDSQ